MAKSQEQMDKEYEAFYRKTGELVREWAELELILSWVVSVLLLVDEFRARVVLGSFRSFDAKRRLILQLSATFADEATHEFLIGAMQKAKDLARNRNMVVHQLGGVSGRKNQLVFISDTNDPEIGVNFLGARRIDQDSIRAWTKDIATLRGELAERFSQSGSARVHALPKMHRERRVGRTE